MAAMTTRNPRHTLRSKVTVVCKRCRQKKLKCDDRTSACNNCDVAREICVIVDAQTGREYSRDYIAHLQARLEHLKSPSRQSVAQPSDGRLASIEVYSPVSGQCNARSGAIFNGEGSIYSLGKLVAAAVSTQRCDQSMLQLGNMMAGEQLSIEKLQASPAQLPSFDMANDLFTSYLNSPHVVLPFLNRRQTLNQLKRAYECPDTTPPSQSDMFHTYMVLAIGSVPKEQEKRYSTSPLSYYLAAQQYMDYVWEFDTHDQIQSMLLLLLFGLLHDVGIGSKWDLARQAMRLCIQHGYHRRPVLTQDQEMEQRQRILFWCCYISDRHRSAVLGRPMTIEDRDITVEMPGKLDNYRPGSIDEVEILNRQVHLRRLTSAIHCEFYAIAEVDSGDLLQKQLKAQKIHEQLVEWRESVNIPRDARNAYETAEFADINFHRDRMRLFTGLSLHWDNEIQSSDMARYLQACLESGMQIISAYSSLLQCNLLITNWSYVQDILSSGFIILHCLTRLPTCEGYFGVKLQPRVVDKAIDTCQEILNDIAVRWKTVEPHKKAFEHLSRAVKNHHISEVPSAMANDDSNADHAFSPQAIGESVQGLDSGDSRSTVNVIAATNLGLSPYEFRQVFGFDVDEFQWCD